MAYDVALAARVRKVLAPRADLVEKHMFGGVCFMVRGHMCCGVADASLMVRLDPAEADALADEPHVRPMDFTGRPMRGFLFVDAEGLASPAALRAWVGRTTSYAESKPVKTPSTKSRAADVNRASGSVSGAGPQRGRRRRVERR
jgi:hypothetical protein